MAQPLSGQLRLGLTADGRLVAGLDAYITAFPILYASMVFVDEAYRRKGLGARLIRGMVIMPCIFPPVVVSVTPSLPVSAGGIPFCHESVPAHTSATWRTAG